MRVLVSALCVCAAVIAAGCSKSCDKKNAEKEAAQAAVVAAKSFPYDIRGEYTGTGLIKNAREVPISIEVDEEYKLVFADWVDFSSATDEISILWEAPDRIEYKRTREHDHGGGVRSTQEDHREREGANYSVTYSQDYEQANVIALDMKNYRFDKKRVAVDAENTGVFKLEGSCLVARVKARIPRESRKVALGQDDLSIKVGSIHAMSLIHKKARSHPDYKFAQSMGAFVKIESVLIEDTSFGLGAAGVGVLMNHANGRTEYTKGWIEATDATTYEVDVLKGGEWKLEVHLCRDEEMYALNMDRKVTKGQYVRYDLEPSGE